MTIDMRSLTITGLWHRTIGDRAQVLVEFESDGKWHVVSDQPMINPEDNNWSEIVEPLGMSMSPEESQCS